MKRIKEKFRRTVKYWRISYKQASGNDRLSLGMLTLVMVAYAWLILVVVPK